MKRRIVVTGMGVLSPVGSDVKNFWHSLSSGKSGITTITKFDATNFPVRIGGEIQGFNPALYLDAKEIRQLDSFTLYALIAAKEALLDAGLMGELDNQIQDIRDLDRFGAVVGSGVGGNNTFEEQHSQLLSRGSRGVSPYFIPKMIPDIAAGYISIKWGLKGPNYCTVSACSSAAHAIGDALRLIQYGDADIMVAGGSEASIAPMLLAGFANMKALSRRNEEPEKASRPFDLDRDGFVLGEGAGILILEESGHAVARDAKIYGEIAGYGATADAYHLTAPAPNGEGATRAIKKALNDATISPEEVDYINAHGTSTPLNDKTETEAIKTAFGDHAYTLHISSTKSMMGHLLGASGAVEAIASLLALHHGIIPPTINYETPDPECNLNYTPNTAIQKQIRVAISNSFGFGGHNAVLVFKQWKK